MPHIRCTVQRNTYFIVSSMCEHLSEYLAFTEPAPLSLSRPNAAPSRIRISWYNNWMWNASPALCTPFIYFIVQQCMFWCLENWRRLNADSRTDISLSKRSTLESTNALVARSSLMITRSSSSCVWCRLLLLLQICQLPTSILLSCCLVVIHVSTYPSLVVDSMNSFHMTLRRRYFRRKQRTTTKNCIRSTLLFA